jgi:hypothetical protein
MSMVKIAIAKSDSGTDTEATLRRHMKREKWTTKKRRTTGGGGRTHVPIMNIHVTNTTRTMTSLKKRAVIRGNARIGIPDTASTSGKTVDQTVIIGGGIVMKRMNALRTSGMVTMNLCLTTVIWKIHPPLRHLHVTTRKALSLRAGT